MSSKTNETAAGQYELTDPEELAQNLAEVAKRSLQLASLISKPRSLGAVEDQVSRSFSSSFATLGQVFEAWMNHPKDMLEIQSEIWARQMELWSSALQRIAGEEVEPVIEPQQGDRRFADKDWSENPAFDFIKQMYLLATESAEKMVERAEGLDEHTRHKATFYVRQLANALAPTNFIFTNPKVLRETLASNGGNLVKGLDNLTRDIERGGGELRIRQTDPDAFKVGESLATAPGKVVFQNELFQLIQYRAATKQVWQTPLLIIPPWINKFYILDLTKEKSFIRWAVDAGHTVFVVSWVNPDETLALKSFEDYMSEGILTALETVLATTGESRANIIGYCVGGTLLAVTLSYLAAHKRDLVSSVTFLAAQVDFSHAGDLNVFIDDDQLDAMERKLTREGYLDAASMAQTFNLLRSNDLIWSNVINNYLLGRDPLPFDLLYWNSDATRLPAANHLFYLRECYQKNNLAQGRMVLDDTKLDVTKVTTPVYSLATREDHIAPALSVFTGVRLFSGPVHYVLAASGHIAGVVNPPVMHKYSYWSDGSGDNFGEWLASATEKQGSWWPDWQDWIEQYCGDKVNARRVGTGKFKAIEDAPGSYVKVIAS